MFRAIDPPSLIDASLDPNASRERELSVIARRLKLLTPDLDIPVIMTAELGRTVEQRIDKGRSSATSANQTPWHK
jgi:replicative DNA helicase